MRIENKVGLFPIPGIDKAMPKVVVSHFNPQSPYPFPMPSKYNILLARREYDKRVNRWTRRCLIWQLKTTELIEELLSATWFDYVIVRWRDDEQIIGMCFNRMVDEKKLACQRAVPYREFEEHRSIDALSWVLESTRQSMDAAMAESSLRNDN